MKDKAPTEPPARQWRMQVVQTDGSKVRHSGEGLVDELLVSELLHLEWLVDETWNLQIGDAQITASILADGRIQVDIVRGAYAEKCGRNTTWEQENR